MTTPTSPRSGADETNQLEAGDREPPRAHSGTPSATAGPVGTPGRASDVAAEDVTPEGVAAEGAPEAAPVGRMHLRSGRSAWSLYVVSLVVLGLFVLALAQDEYLLSLAISGLMFAGLATAWNIIGGFGGQFSLAHSVFFGIGAYSVALLQVRQDWSPWAALPVGVVLAGGVSALLAWPLFRLRGPFFAIGTLALSEVTLALATYFEWTGGSSGVLIPFTAQPIDEPLVWAYVFLAFLALCLAVALWISRSRLGYYLIAVRDDHDAAAAVGANPLAVKTTALVVSASLTALGGGLFVMYVGSLDPPQFLSSIEIGAFVPLLALIGGIGTIVGPVVGALVLQPGEAYLRGQLAGLHPGISEAIVGLLLILAALFFREGIWGTLLLLRARLGGGRRARALRRH